MKAISIVSAVVFLHVFVFITLVNGCRGTQDTSYKTLGQIEYEEPVTGQEITDPPLVEEPAVGKEATAPSAGTTPAKSEPQKTTEEGPKYYVVKPNESLWIIAKRNNISTKQLASANNLPLNGVLRIGQKIVIPAPGTEVEETKNVPVVPVSNEIYIVKKGDTLGGIAIKLKTSVAKLKAANNLNSDRIRINQKLKIPAKNDPEPKKEQEKKSEGAKPQEATSTSATVPEVPAEPETTAVPEVNIDPADASAEPVSGQPA